MHAQTAVVETSSSRKFQRKIAFLAGAGMFIDGFDVAVIAVALPGLTVAWDITDPLLKGIVASSVVVGMFFGMMFGGRLVDIFGRRKMYLFDLIGFVVFALLAAVAQDVWQLIFARFALGLFIGADYPISSSVTAEFTSPKRRGKMIIFMSFMWQLGALTAYISGILLMQAGDNAWRWMLAGGAILAVIVIFFRHSMPESPRWLRAKGRVAEAEQIERDVFEQHGLLIDSTPLAQTANSKAGWRELFTPKMLRATVFCSIFWFAFAISFYGIQMYTPSILAPLVTDRPHLAFLGAALIAFLGVVGASLAMLAVEKVGRRIQIIVCFAGMVIALVVLAVSDDPSVVMLVTLLSVTILLANLGPGVLNMVYPNEMFPTRLRGSGVGFAGAFSRIGSILGILVFPLLVASWGTASATWLFAGVGIIGLLVSIWLAPETKGRSIEELDALANNGWRDDQGRPVYYRKLHSGASGTDA